MPIPFPPDGPQVQAALQKVPTPQLQQYASGQPPQPTGQVAPGPMGAAAQALNARGAMGAANQRQQAMQNNPANSPTIFQQKDMELQQKAQQLAAMGQQMQQQMQQKEQQLGVMGALMAKKAQALQAREQGLAMLPISENMFTAMNGGIVFSGGGAVQRFNGRQGSGVGFLTDPRSQMYTNAGEDVAEEAKTKLAQLESLLSTTSSEQARTALLTEIASLRNIVSKYSRVPSTVGEPEPTTYAPEPKKEDKKSDDKTPSAARKPSSSTKTPTLPGVTSLGSNRPTLDEGMQQLEPYIARSPEQSLYARKYDDKMQAIAKLAEDGVISDETAKQMMDARKAEMAAQYGRYTQGRGARQEELIKSMQGEAPTFQERIGKGLSRLPTDLRGVRLGGLFGALGTGAAEVDAEYKKRMRETNAKRAEIQELNAKADLLEERGQMAEADKVRKEAEARAKDRSLLRIKGEEAGASGIASLLDQATKEQQGRTRAATDLQNEERRFQNQAQLEQARAKNQIDLEKYKIDAQAALQAGKEDEFVKRARQIAEITGQDVRAVLQQLLKGNKDPDAYSSTVQGKIYDTIAAKYADPHNPAVIAEIQKINPNAAKILSLGKEEAKRQSGYGAALAVVEQAMNAEIRSRLNKPQSYTDLPAPPSK